MIVITQTNVAFILVYSQVFENSLPSITWPLDILPVQSHDMHHIRSVDVDPCIYNTDTANTVAIYNRVCNELKHMGCIHT